MKKPTHPRSRKPLDYPVASKGNQLAARVRSATNQLSESQREELFKQGMQTIYGGTGPKETVDRR